MAKSYPKRTQIDITPDRIQHSKGWDTASLTFQHDFLRFDKHDAPVYRETVRVRVPDPYTLKMIRNQLDAIESHWKTLV